MDAEAVAIYFIFDELTRYFPTVVTPWLFAKAHLLFYVPRQARRLGFGT
jgi:hypothetical protein